MEAVQARKQRMISGALTDQEVRSARIDELKMLFTWTRQKHTTYGDISLPPAWDRVSKSYVKTENLIFFQWTTKSNVMWRMKNMIFF